MNRTIYRLIQCGIMLGLAGFLAERWWSGRLTLYINQRFTPLTLVAILGFAFMAAAGLIGLRSRKESSDAVCTCCHEDCQTENEPHHEDHDENPSGHEHQHNHNESPISGLVLIGLPLLIGLIFPARPLSATSLDTRSISSTGLSSSNQSATSRLLDTPIDSRNILNWVQLFNYTDDTSELIGQEADVVGFVYHDPRLDEGQFMVSRFTISCCVADALAIGMVVDWKDAGSLDDNTWVRVTGPVQAIELDYDQFPLIQADQVEIVDQPIQPYLFP